MRRGLQPEEKISHARTVLSQSSILLISIEEKILRNVNMVVRGQVKSENSSLPVTVRVSKTCVPKLPYINPGNPTCQP